MSSRESTPRAFTGKVRTGKSVSDESYAPFIELDCRLCRKLVADLSLPELVVVDIGARGGFDPRLQVFGDRIRYVGFEPDPQEALRLTESIKSAGLENVRHVFQAALWDREATLPLYIQRCKESTSVFQPNMSFLSRLPDPTANENVGRTEITATTLDACTLPTGPGIDIIKMDVEGAELAILKGAAESLRNEVLAVIPEVTFVERYVGQPFFAEVDQFLRTAGFSLFDLKVRRWRRKPLTAEFDNLRVGQLVYGDALYLKDPIAVPNFCRPELEKEKCLKLAALAEFFSLPDFAIELVEWGYRKGFLTAQQCETYRSTLLENTIVARSDFNQF